MGWTDAVDPWVPVIVSSALSHTGVVSGCRDTRAAAMQAAKTTERTPRRPRDYGDPTRSSILGNRRNLQRVHRYWDGVGDITNVCNGTKARRRIYPPLFRSKIAPSSPCVGGVAVRVRSTIPVRSRKLVGSMTGAL